MPKTIVKEDREKLKQGIMRLLSIDGRMSFQRLGDLLGVSKITAYNLFLEVKEQYGLVFVPEININEIWKYEFLKMSSHKSTKKELKEEALEKLEEFGFQEYMVFYKFINGMPTDEEINSYINNPGVPESLMKESKVQHYKISKEYLPLVQYACRLKGEYDIMLFVLARDYRELDVFLRRFGTALGKYTKHCSVNRVRNELGFFPIKREAVERFQISETYKQILLGLTDDGRQSIKKIATTMKTKPETLVYGMERLTRTNLLTRVSYYETKPTNNINALVIMEIIDQLGWSETREKLFMKMVTDSDSNGKHTEYLYLSYFDHPNGIVAIMSFANNTDLDSFINFLYNNVKGINVKYYQMTSTINGNLGIRDFDMKYSSHYKMLERAKLMPRVKRLEKIFDSHASLSGKFGDE